VFGSKKVLWKEGLFLQPQHFQQSERFLLESFHSRFSLYNAYGYGFSALKINTDAVANGSFTLLQAQGIMPDGANFDIPGKDLIPPSRPFAEHFTHDQQSLDVFLALPVVDTNRANVFNAADNTGATRYQIRVEPVSDEVFGKKQKDIEVVDFNFRILFSDESRENYSSIPIARLVRKSSGQIEIDETYVPPLLQIGASQFFMDKLRTLLELLLAKNASLSQSRKQVAGGFAEYVESNKTAYDILHTINTYTPLLNYHHFVPIVHPFDLFTLLIQFSGALCTFSTEITLRKLPRYEHNNLGQVITTFDAIIRKIVGADISAGCVSIPVEKYGPANYLCKITERSFFTEGKFYFGVAAEVSEKELVVATLSRIKMCSREKLELLIPSAMPGIPLIHVAQPPKELTTKPSFIYFKLEQHGTFWDGIVSSGTIAFYFPHQYKDLKLEMLVLRG